MRRPNFMLLVLLVGFGTGTVRAQDVRTIVQVEFISGQNVYLGIGEASGLQEQDTLLVYRAEQPLGRLQVVAVAEARTVTTFAGAPFAITRGDSLLIVFTPRGVADAPVSVAAPDSIEAERESLFEQGVTGVQLPPVEEGVRFTGRISVGLDLLSTHTEGLRSDFERTRTYRIPFANVRLTAEDLPGNLRMNLHTRMAYRSNESRLGINPTGSVRVYQLNIERALVDTPVDIRMGRFFNPAESFSGYWDGIQFAYQPYAGLGGGVLAGIQPDRADEGFSTTLPKYTLFGTYVHRIPGEAFRYDLDVSFHEVRPTNDLLTHTFLGLAHTLRWERFRIRNRVQLDRDPEADGWAVTQFQIHGSVPVHTRFQVRARYDMRQPYQIWRTRGIVGYRRDRLSAGFTLQAFSGVLSGDIATNHSDLEDRSYTYTAFLNMPRLVSTRIGFNTVFSYWRREDEVEVLYLAPGFTRSFGRVSGQVQYQYQSSTFDPIKTVRHAVEASVQIPLTSSIRSSIQYRTQFGDLARSNRLYTTLWMRL